MIPIVKGWSTEVGQEVASLGIQVHGGMGFIEETGAAQHLRDARITTIYEGTTGIQANDLIGRKTARDAGAVAKAIAGEIDKVAARLAARKEPALQAIGVQLGGGVADVQAAIEWMVPAYGTAAARGACRGGAPTSSCGDSPSGGWQMGRAALVAADRLADGRGRPAVPARQDRHRALSTRTRCCRRPRRSRTRSLHGGESALALPAEAF